MKKRFWIISYDIPDDKRRNKVAKQLTGYGERIQYSVFQCYLDGRQRKTLKKCLEKIINAEEDSVYYFKLCETCYREIKTSGIAAVEEWNPIVVV